MIPSQDAYGAFLPYPAPALASPPPGPLNGLTFAVKDLFDVAGFPTGCGSPLWLAEHGLATRDATAVAQMRAAGALLKGKTHTDELAWGLFGLNPHFGAPVNPAAPNRAPGGSSSGSAVAVASGSVDVALGTDTGGSTRIPASFCGIWGMRPTHGSVSLAGCAGLAPSFDTCGWFSRDLEGLAKVGAVLTPPAPPSPKPVRWLLAQDMLDQVDPPLAQAIRALVDELGVPVTAVNAYGQDPAALRDAFTVLQHREAVRTLGAWIDLRNPPLDPAVAGRYAYAKTLTKSDERSATQVRSDLTSHLDDLLADDGVLIAPIAHEEALLLGASEEQAAVFRRRLIALTCLAGLSGLPQISAPAFLGGAGAPIALSFIGRRGQDQGLLEAVRSLALPAPRAL